MLYFAALRAAFDDLTITRGIIAELAGVRGRHAELHQRPVLTYVATLIRLAGG